MVYELKGGVLTPSESNSKVDLIFYYRESTVLQYVNNETKLEFVSHYKEQIALQYRI